MKVFLLSQRQTARSWIHTRVPSLKHRSLTARVACRRNQKFWTLWHWIIIIIWIIVSSCSFVRSPSTKPSRAEPSLLPLTFLQPLHLRGQSPWAICSMCVCCTRLLNKFGVCSVTLCSNIRARTWRIESNQTLAATVWLDSPLQQLFYATGALRRLETVDEGYEYVCCFFWFVFCWIIAPLPSPFIASVFAIVDKGAAPFLGARPLWTFQTAGFK